VPGGCSTTATAPLGCELLMEFEGLVGGFGRGGKPFFWIREGEPASIHLAFAARNRDEVDAFYAAAIAAGGEENGPPGLRTTTRATTARTCSIRTATTSKRSFTTARDGS
jgi:hypothetical protein